MSTAQPPIVATSLLKRLGSGPNNDALIGDLAEEYGRGRSRAWYWRQALVAIVVSFCKETRSHSALALRAVAVGWAVIFLYRSLLRAPAMALYAQWSYLPGHTFSNWAVQHFYWYLIHTPVLAFAGWIVARLHRRHQMAMVWAFAASKVLTFAPHFIVYAAQSFRDTSYASWASNEVWASVTTTAMILLGGMWRVPTAAMEFRKIELPSRK
jgi:hypothetical protein